MFIPSFATERLAQGLVWRVGVHNHCLDVGFDTLVQDSCEQGALCAHAKAVAVVLPVYHLRHAKIICVAHVVLCDGCAQVSKLCPSMRGLKHGCCNANPLVDTETHQHQKTSHLQREKNGFSPTRRAHFTYRTPRGSARCTVETPARGLPGTDQRGGCVGPRAPQGRVGEVPPALAHPATAPASMPVQMGPSPSCFLDRRAIPSANVDIVGSETARSP